MAGLRFDPDPAAQSLEHFLADGQADARTLKLFAAVQTLEQNEDPFKVLRLDPQAVIAHAEDPFPVTVTRDRDMNAGGVGTAVLDCVADEVLKDLGQLGVVRRDRG